MSKKNINLSVIVPIFNEEKTLIQILNQIKYLEKFCNLEVLLVNDGSTDKSKEIILNNQHLYSKSIHLKKNFGKGKAVIEGLKNCIGDYVLIQDADLEYEPKDIEKFLKKIHKYEADLIIGNTYRLSKDLEKFVGKKIHTIYNPCYFPNKKIGKINKKNKKKIILNVSRLENQKDHLTLLKAFLFSGLLKLMVATEPSISYKIVSKPITFSPENTYII